MSQQTFETCPDCKITLPAHSGETHPYLGASPSCWAMFGGVLAREYSSPQLMQIHRLTVDADAAQHLGQPDRRSIQSGWVHLVGLYLTIDRKLSHTFARNVIGNLTHLGEPLNWLEPPEDLGAVTVRDVYLTETADQHLMAVQGWAESVWAAWRPHRQAIVQIADRAVARL